LISSFILVNSFTAFSASEGALLVEKPTILIENKKLQNQEFILPRRAFKFFSLLFLHAFLLPNKRIFFDETFGNITSVRIFHFKRQGISNR